MDLAGDGERHRASARRDVDVHRVAPPAQPADRLLREVLGRVARDEHAGPRDDLETAEHRVALDELDGLAVRAAGDHPVESTPGGGRDLLVGLDVLHAERVTEQVLGLDQLAILLPVIDRGGRPKRLHRALEQLRGVHGRARYQHRGRAHSRGTIASCRRRPQSKPRKRRAPTEDVRLTGDRIVVEHPDDGERTSRGGLLIPATAVPAPKRCVWGVVALVGPDVRTARTGDRILYLPQAGLEVELNGHDYLLLRERDVQAVSSPADGGEHQPGQYL